MPTLLTGKILDETVANLPGWSLENGQLTRKWKFPDFSAAIKFVNQVAEIAETANHHPDIDIRYNVVITSLSTHDAGGITDLDIQIARTLLQKFGSE
ncbi:4a-hydroxytetrahydrobiopterin dehydratase [Granulicella cerasi]|uniref:Putative pterin-4-alpha-carbinolamine dehydratase n=1 Tax=Granulicella cerasi TaxID=741063 RepID=A0ABW1Z3T7_9BACT|nr:4a-hydroxytetrahydrobiopterin dehydratase [Granulicella cerasi]